MKQKSDMNTGPGRHDLYTAQRATKLEFLQRNLYTAQRATEPGLHAGTISIQLKEPQSLDFMQVQFVHSSKSHKAWTSCRHSLYTAQRAREPGLHAGTVCTQLKEPQALAFMKT